MTHHQRRQLTWLFDLDNTLHDASHAIFPAIHANMDAYMARVLGQDGIPADAATVATARQEYLRRYGATLLGMVKHHQVHEEEFLREAHSFDDLTSMIRAEIGLSRLLKRLPGRKILLTNAPRGYSREVMRHLGLHRHFARHIAIESMYVHGQLRPKPSAALMRKIVKNERINASRCVLVEDTLKNLRTAKRLGMRTAWVTGYLESGRRPIKRPAWVDVKVKSIAKLAKNLQQIYAVGS